jgi:signal transduction histidine kinase
MLQARDQLLLDVSHDLRSPLTRMKVALELMPDHKGSAGMAADLAEMEAMITELLELERLPGWSQYKNCAPRPSADCP